MSDESAASTIMVVDDDTVFAASLAASLRRRGHRAVVAHDYDEALAEAEAWTPPRAVVDLRMPGRGGLELVQALLERWPEMSVVVLTGYGSIATAVEAMKLGAIHYLTKPASVADVIAAFDRTRPSLVAPPAEAEIMPIDQVEWEHLQRVLTDCSGNISEAARRLGMHRRSLQRKLARRPRGAD